jgi:hypothetical protein
MVVSVASVSAETTLPDPPLLDRPGWAVVALGLAALALAVLALTELTVRRALRGDHPTRSAWSLE